MSHKDFTGRGKVAIVRTSPQTVLEDYARLMGAADYRFPVLPPQHGAIWNQHLMADVVSRVLHRSLARRGHPQVTGRWLY